MRFNSAMLATLFVQLSAWPSFGQAPTSFTYQGELRENGCLAEGVYAMTFSIWNSAEGGSQIGPTASIPEVTVNQGRFTVQLSMGPEPFVGSTARWLEMAVEGVTLSPRERITSSPYSIQTRGLWVDEDYNVGIRTSSPQAALDVFGDVELRGDVNLGGEVNVSERLGVGNPSALYGQLTIVDSGAGAPFGISVDWNNNSFATIFASNAGSGGVLLAQGTSDAQPDGGGLIVAGDEAGFNIAIDANEIMARESGGTAPLYLNNDGGDVVVGGPLHIGWVYLVESIDSEFGTGRLYCPEGKRPLGGGCESSVGLDAIESSTPFCDEDGCGWSCNMDNSDGALVHVICANVR